MSFLAVRYWYEDLEPRDKWKLAGMLVGALVLLTPSRREITLEALVKPNEGSLISLISPGQGYIREMPLAKDKVLMPGDLAFSYVPQVDYGRNAKRGFAQDTFVAQSYSTAYQDDERKIRDRYKQQISDAYTYITSYQEQLNRAYAEHNSGSNGDDSSAVQSAQNALNRAQQVPGELARKQEQELAAIRNQRDSNTRMVQFAQGDGSPCIGGAALNATTGDMAVTVNQRVFVWSAAIGASVTPGQECASLLPEGAALEVTTAVPVAFLSELRVGTSAALEVLNWMHDAENTPLRVEKIGNRNLTREEVLALMPKALPEVQFVLVTFKRIKAEGGLFPPPKKCKVQLVGVPRCLLQRLFS